MKPLIVFLLAASGTISVPAPPPKDVSTAAERAFLQSAATAPGVVVLPGLEYQSLRSGPLDGAHPTRSDDIVVRYRGVLPDGRVFSASPGDGAETVRFTLQKLIPGWVAALQLMRPGDVWRLFVPAYLAYGASGKNLIPPMTPLTFQVELVSISPTPKEPGR